MVCCAARFVCSRQLLDQLWDVALQWGEFYHLLSQTTAKRILRTITSSEQPAQMLEETSLILRPSVAEIGETLSDRHEGGCSFRIITPRSWVVIPARFPVEHKGW